MADTAVLRLFHISDLHWIDGDPKQLPHQAVTRTRLDRVLDGITGRALKRRIIERTAGHDPDALALLRVSLCEEAEHRDDEPDWRGKTHLIATGDLTTWGDDASLNDSIAEINDIGNAAGIPTHILYGNHDAWPAKLRKLEGFPFVAPLGSLEDHRIQLRAAGGHFSDTFPIRYVTAPCGPLNLVVAALNTIRHGRISNSIARGEVTRDRYWEIPPGPKQMDELGKLFTPADFAIVLTHHPIYDVTKPLFSHLPGTPMLLTNRTAVAQALDPHLDPRAPAAFAVLSGHTHDEFPRLGALQSSLPHGPLGDRSIQLTTGTVSQNQFKPGLLHTWQMVSFLWDENTRALTIERILFKRGGNSSPFAAIAPDEAHPENVAERFVVTL